jgi:hypothetical protein
MKISQYFNLQKDPSADPLFEMHIDLTQMTAREFQNALVVFHDIVPKFDVVLRELRS